MRHDHFKYIFYNIKYQFSFSISSAFILLRIMEKLNEFFSKVMSEAMLFILSISLLIGLQFFVYILYPGASLAAQMVNSLPTMQPAVQETRVQSLGQEDPLQKEVATHSSVLAWEIPWTAEPDGLQSMGLQKGQTGLIS